MNDMRPSFAKDITIIIFIFVVIVSVVLIFYTEYVKNQKIRISKNNFYIVKEELTKEVLKCRDTNLKWFSRISCTQRPTKDMIDDYFNNTKKLVNPYDKQNGVDGTPGSVIINQQAKKFILSVDIDANEGIDIYHNIYFD
jgi:hypothetical protein